MATTMQSHPDRVGLNTSESPTKESIVDPLAAVFTQLRTDPVLTVLAAKTIELGTGLSNKARTQRAKEVVASMGLECGLFEVVIRRGTSGGYGFRLGSSRTIGHIIAHVVDDGPATGLLIAGDMVLAVNDHLLCRTVHETAVKLISGTDKIHLMVCRAASVMAQPVGATLRLTFNREIGQLLGLRLATEIDEDGNATASMVQKAIADSVAHTAGFLVGDKLIVVNGIPVNKASRHVVLGTMSGVVGDVVVDVRRKQEKEEEEEEGVSNNDPNLAIPRTTDERCDAQSNSPKAGPPEVPQRRSSLRKLSRAPRERPGTVYIATNMPIPKKAMFSRFRASNGGATLPATFAISDMNRELAEEALACRDDGAFLLRKAHGQLVLSVVHERAVGHYTLQISLSQSYREVDKALRKFVKFYSVAKEKQLERIGLLCPLREYVMGASSNALNLMQQLHAAGSTSSGDESSGSQESLLTPPASELTARPTEGSEACESEASTTVATEWGNDNEAEMTDAHRETRHPTGGGFEIPEQPAVEAAENHPKPVPEPITAREGTRLQIATVSILGESNVDPLRMVHGSSSTDPASVPNAGEDEDGLPLLSPTTDMFNMSDTTFVFPPPPAAAVFGQSEATEMPVDSEMWESGALPPPPPPPPVQKQDDAVDEVRAAIVLPPPPPPPVEPTAEPKRKAPPPVMPRQRRPSARIKTTSEPASVAIVSQPKDEVSRASEQPATSAVVPVLEPQSPDEVGDEPAAALAVTTASPVLIPPAPPIEPQSEDTVREEPPAASLMVVASRARPLDAVAAPASAGEPRRRKLVRGGNKRETPILQGYADALKALSTLDAYLAECEAEWVTAAMENAEQVDEDSISPASQTTPTPTPPPPPPLATPQRSGFRLVESHLPASAISDSLLY